MDVTERRVLVTGGATGLGIAIATEFARTGARVWIVDSNPESLARALATHPELNGEVADVASEPDVVRTCTRAAAELGPLDVLVNNAGIAGPAGPVETLGIDDWNRTLAVNATGMFLFCRALVPAMKERRSGSIVNISTASVRTGLPNRTAYVVSKYAVHGLTANLARELGPWGIRCNALLPGLLDTPRGRGLVERHAAAQGSTVAEAEADMLRYISMRTWIAPAEVAAMAVFLASDAARHVSGQFVGVCGNAEWEG